MDEIVIVTDKSRVDWSLLAWVSALFPDCKINAVFRDVETLDKGLAEPSSRPLPKDIPGRDRSADI